MGSGPNVPTQTPYWWHDRDHLYTVLRDLLKHLRRRASTFDTRIETWLHLSGIHLGQGPWRYVEEVDVVGEVPFETGLILVNAMLARLQELTWEQHGRAAIGHAHDRIDQIFNPIELDWLRPDDTDPRDEE